MLVKDNKTPSHPMPKSNQYSSELWQNHTIGLLGGNTTLVSLGEE